MTATIHFEFATATRIIFGAGALGQAGGLVQELGGRRPLVVAGHNPDRIKPLETVLRAYRLDIIPFSFTGEPDLETVRHGVAAARNDGCDLVISLGGGSVIDAGKAIAAMLTNPGDILDFVEVIGRGKTLARPAAPFIAIPTTAGTGSEATRNAVLASPEQRVKVSLRSPLMLPRIALIDPELTYDLPPALTATTGLDALTQLIEPYVCSRANPMTDALCTEGMGRVARALPRAFENGHDTTAREDMALASLFGGLALANAGLGAVHGFAAPFGGMFAAPHGAVCAALLPHVMEANTRALRQRQPGGEALRRFYAVARLLTGKNRATADDGVQWVRRLVAGLKIPPLSRYGLKAEHMPELIEKAAQASSMKANPIALTPGELRQILERATG